MFKSGSSSPITALKLSKYCLIALGSHLHENENQPCRSFEAGHCVAVEGMADRKVPSHDVRMVWMVMLSMMIMMLMLV